MSNLDVWKQFTQARIGLRRSGGSISTKEMLQFRLDHARAKDAVVKEPSWDEITKQCKDLTSQWNLQTLFVKSQVTSKEEYLLRPDLGRRLTNEAKHSLLPFLSQTDLSIICMDGLSARAIDENLIPFLKLLLVEIKKTTISLSPLVLVRWGRVALGDEIASGLGAKMSLVIIGERPGLSSSDSLGLYLTYAPKIGNTDEVRNCISNVRPMGLPLSFAVQKTLYLIQESFRQQRSGVLLKDQMPEAPKEIVLEKTKLL